ncbi:MULTISPECIES: glycosyltransferase family 39 protein [unclassified Empedobacter]|uniref:ArnT family glycosyltransferase n=1 Tax=unclassified Empedobacter TaxID=2643773 RepID=UPI00244944EC|nr:MULTISPECIES: glycosyltransferase family 39 protein [unclassified Empedobacter]MDH0659055.1 glycosyltransferase family 39 protein [Empedobacter sp. GD03865]
MDIKISWKHFLLLLFIILPITLININKDPIFLWDEGRNSLNALEMYYNNNFIVTHYNGEPDMWNTKPPLLIWLQTFFMYLVGVNELAIRIPTIISALLTCILLYVFSKKILNNEWISIFVSTVLITTNGYIAIHGARTGDYDTLLTLFVTISSLSIFLFTETKQNKWLYIFFVSLSLSVLTKGIAGLLFTPAYLILIIFTKQLFKLLKNKHFYYAIFIFLFIVISYYSIREILNPGYIKAVYENELGGRLNTTLDGLEEKNTFYYFENLFNDVDRFKNWIYFLPICFIISLFNPNKKILKLSLYIASLIIIHYLVLTKASTKYEWYDTPWFPLFSLIIGLGVYTIYVYLNNKRFEKILMYSLVLSCFTISSFSYYNIYNKITSNQDEYQRNMNLLSLFFQEVRYGERIIDNNLFYCADIPQYNAMFYINQLNKDYNFNIKLKDWNSLIPGDIVVVGQSGEIKSNIENKYSTEILEDNQTDWQHWGIKIYKIINIK